MPRGVLKENLPEKMCVSCGRPFTWRKKWERCWDEVTTCSKSCNAKRKEAGKSKKVPRGGAKPPTIGGAADDDDDNEDDDDDDTVADAVGGLALAPAPRQRARVGVDRSGASAESESESSVAPVVAVAPTEEDRIALTAFAASAPLLDEASDDAATDADSASDSGSSPTPLPDPRLSKKALKKAFKAHQRDKRTGGTSTSSIGRKSCDICDRAVDLLVRCTVDSTQRWNMVCGKCWKDVSGGVADGDLLHPHYKYGGLWKNRCRSVA